MAKQTQVTNKKRKKATYLRRKEEHDALTEQVLELEKQLAEVQVQQDSGVMERLELLQSFQLKEMLEDAMEKNSIRVATTQSLMSEWMQNLSGNPMGVHIHLSREWTERRDSLLEVKDERLARGFRYVSARCQHLSPLKSHKSEEHFEDANGDFCCALTEVIPFPGVQSMRTVFDTIKFGVNTLEISISEESGDITVREDYDTVDADSFVSNYRLTSKNDGVTTELNTVVSGQYFENGKTLDGKPYAAFAFDSVNQDDLHPYHPQNCVRKDINGTIVAIPITRKKVSAEKSVDRASKGEESDEDEVVIVILRSFFFRTHRPQFEVSEAFLQGLRSNVTRWGEIYTQELRRMLHS